MARLWTCGFEEDTTTTAIAGFSTSFNGGGAFALSASTVRTGARSARVSAATAGRASSKVDLGSLGTSAHVYARAYIYVAAYPAASYMPIFMVGNGVSLNAGTNAGLLLRSNGNLVVGAPSTASGTESSQVPLNTWTRIEFDYDDATDTCIGYLNGTAFSTVSSLTVGGGDGLFFGSGGTTTSDVYWDDIALNDNSGSAQNGLPGDGGIVVLRPAGVGDTNQWTTGAVGGTAGAANNFTRVNENPPSETQYNRSTAGDSSTNEVDEYTLPSSSSVGISSGDAIRLVQVSQYVGSNTGGTGFFIKTRIKSQSGGTLLESSDIECGNSSFNTPVAGTNSRRATLVSYVNPQTGSSWTPTALDSAQIGVKATGASASQRRLGAIWAIVEYGAPASTTHNASGTSAGVGSTSSTAVVVRSATGTSAGVGSSSGIADVVPAGDSLFTSQTPTSTNLSDGTPAITTATTIQFSQAGTIRAVRWYVTTNNGGTWTGAVWEVTSGDGSGAGTGTLLSSAVKQLPPSAGGWDTIYLNTPVSVTTGKLYRVGVHNSQGRYVATASFFVSPLTNGNIIAEANGQDPVGLGTLRQGTYEINSSLTYPTQSFNNASYFIDVIYQASGGTTHNASGTSAGVGGSSGTQAKTTAGSGTSAGTGASTGVADKSTVASGTSAGIGSSSGSLVKSTDASGTSAGVGSTSGSEFLTKTAAGTSTGTGSSSGQLALVLAVAGTSAGAGSTSGTALGGSDSSGTSAGVGASSGSLVRTAGAAGTSAGSGSSSGALARTTAAAGTSSGVGGTFGTADVAGPNIVTVTGTSSGIGASSGSAARTAFLVGASSGLGTSAGFETRALALVGTSAGVGVSSGVAASGEGSPLVIRPSRGTVLRPNSGIVERPQHVVI